MELLTRLGCSVWETVPEQAQCYSRRAFIARLHRVCMWLARMVFHSCLDPALYRGIQASVTSTQHLDTPGWYAPLAAGRHSPHFSMTYFTTDKTF